MPGKKNQSEQRKERLAAALKANLVRRKAKAREAGPKPRKPAK